MTRRDIINRLKNQFLQLEVMQKYPESFLEALGERGFQQRIDEILDEINYLKRLLVTLGED